MRLHGAAVARLGHISIGYRTECDPDPPDGSPPRRTASNNARSLGGCLCDVIILDDAVAVGDIAAEPERWNAYVLAGLAVWLVIVATDWMSDDVILIPLLVVVPLVTAIGGSVRQTAIIGIVAVVTAVALGWVDDIAGSRRHWVGILATVLAAGLGLWLAATRAAKERQIASSVPAVRRADRLRASLATGRIGEWSWNLAIR